MMLEGNYPVSYPSWLGVGSMFEVAMVEEADDGSVAPLGVAGPVSVIDVGNEVLAFCREYDPVTDSDAEVTPFHAALVQALPDVAVLTALVTSWVSERGDGRAPFLSAQENPGGQSPIAAKASAKKAAAKRVTNAALLEQMNLLVAQVQVIGRRQDALEKATSSKPSAKGVVEQPGGRSVRFPALSDGLNSGAGPPLSVPKVLEMVGPPPKTQLHRMASVPQLASQPEEPNALLLGEIFLAHQGLQQLQGHQLRSPDR